MTTNPMVEGKLRDRMDEEWWYCNQCDRILSRSGAQFGSAVPAVWDQLCPYCDAVLHPANVRRYLRDMGLI